MEGLNEPVDSGGRFEEFRRDPEDMGAWTPVAFYSGRAFSSGAETITAARAAVRWLADVPGFESGDDNGSQPGTPASAS